MTATLSAYLAACRRDLGKEEHPRGSNNTEFAARAHHANGAAWCATFLVAEARTVGLVLPYYGAYTPDFANAFKKIGAYGKTPRVGAFGFVYHPSLGRIAHTFVVEVVYKDGTFGTIEGNSNSDGSREGYEVVRHKRTTNNITFGYPHYAPETAPAKAPAKAAPRPAPKRANPYKVPVLTTRRPALTASAVKTVAEVKYVQWAIGAKDDGKWGAQTSAAVKAFQTKNGLKADAQVGPKTLAAMGKVRR